MRPASDRSTGPIRLLVSDVDGTLVDQDKQLAPATVEAVRRLRAAGIHFAIVSSRPPRGLAMLAGPLAIDGPMGGFNGGTIVGPDFAVLEALTVPEAAAAEAIGTLRGRGADVWLFDADHWRLTAPEGAYVQKELHTVRFPPEIVPSLDPWIGQAGKLVGVSADFALLERCEAELQAALGKAANVHRSQNYYLDITHPEATKGNAVRAIARHWGVPLAEVAVVGDMANDLAMFEVAGLAIAMGNASADIQAQADAVTRSNAEDGLAYAIDRFVLPRAAGR
jgi:Cof subfamily protein (haloacid dehalogenase superfamily)